MFCSSFRASFEVRCAFVGKYCDIAYEEISNLTFPQHIYSEGKWKIARRLNKIPEFLHLRNVPHEKKKTPSHVPIKSINRAQNRSDKTAKKLIRNRRQKKILCKQRFKNS
jgi:hypothetical protein